MSLQSLVTKIQQRQGPLARIFSAISSGHLQALEDTINQDLDVAVHVLAVSSKAVETLGGLASVIIPGAAPVVATVEAVMTAFPALVERIKALEAIVAALQPAQTPVAPKPA